MPCGRAVNGCPAGATSMESRHRSDRDIPGGAENRFSEKTIGTDRLTEMSDFQKKSVIHRPDRRERLHLRPFAFSARPFRSATLDQRRYERSRLLPATLICSSTSIGSGSRSDGRRPKIWEANSLGLASVGIVMGVVRFPAGIGSGLFDMASWRIGQGQAHRPNPRRRRQLAKSSRINSFPLADPGAQGTLDG